MKEEASAAANDPRIRSAAKPYVSPTVSPQDLPIDYAGFLAVIFGVFGVIFHSLSNMRNFEAEFKQISMAFMFGLMGLVTNYFGPARQVKSSR